MKYFAYSLVAISLLNLVELPAQTTVSGPISGTWDTSGSPYFVIDNCVVPTNQSLVIKPGVKVVIGQNLRITVNGWMEAIGTSDSCIQFTAPNDTVYWDKILVNYSLGGVTKFRYCNFNNADTALHLLNAAHTNEAMRNEIQFCTFENCAKLGIQVEAIGTFRSNGMSAPTAFRPHASPIISNNVFDATTDGITLFVQGSRWQHTMGYWYTYGNASPIIAGNVFKNLSGSALEMTKGNITENASFPVFVNNTLWEVSSGVFAQEPYDAIVKNNIFANTEIGVKREGVLTSSVTHNCFYEKNSNNFVGFPLSYGAIVMNNDNDTPCDIGFNIFLDPQFVSGQTYDYRLQSISPCIDAGDPASPPDPDDTRADMGAFYFDQTTVGVHDDTVRIGEAFSSQGGKVSVPILLDSQGDENALGFSLQFDTAVISFSEVAKGRDASNATLNPNEGEVDSGRLGIALALPAGQVFPAGVREIVVLTFDLAMNTTADSTKIMFIDQPIVREVVDINAHTLPAIWISGNIILKSCGVEGDVTPSLGGDGVVSITDWVKVGIFAAGLDQPVAGCEFQKADCSPTPCGDGRIGIADWVQTGLYAAGLDPATPACGPLEPTLLAASVQQTGGIKLTKGASTRTVRIINPNFQPGQMHKVTVELEAQGDENALGFSLNFDPTIVTYESASVGQDAANAVLNINSNKKDNGRVGFALALQTNQAFASGSAEVIVVTFSVKSEVSAVSTPIEFIDDPIVKEIVDVTANVLTAQWTPMTAVTETLKKTPMTFGLSQNYPNPFNPETVILYELPQMSQVEVVIFNLLGERIRTLVNQRQMAGQHRLHWDGRNEFGMPVPSGVYLYRLRAGEFVQTRKMVLMQ
ncbi:T9SS type A sorting domain-containing protein [bacterium]|nr:T9SS type A sorting domain-containing protein [bacterium]